MSTKENVMPLSEKRENVRKLDWWVADDTNMDFVR